MQRNRPQARGVERGRLGLLQGEPREIMVSPVWPLAPRQSTPRTMPSSDSVPQQRLASVSHASSARIGHESIGHESIGHASLSHRAVRSSDSVGVQGEVIGRYTLHTRIAAGGMASVYLGSVAGAADFSRVVAIKRMHPQIAENPTLAARFRDEAWLSARLLHPNIVQTFDVVEWNHELLLIMEYVDGITLRALFTDAEASPQKRLPLAIIAGVLVPVLHGLHAAHLATDDDGCELHIVHRDFSPQNIIIGRDGHAKILDFGIAKIQSNLHTSTFGQLSGKVGYLSPEQILGGAVDRRTDVFAAGVVLWEALAGKRLFREPGISEAATIQRVLDKSIAPPSHINPAVPDELDKIVLHALQRRPSHRFASVREFAFELEAALQLASPSVIGNYLSEVSGPRLDQLSQLLVNTRRRFSVTSRSAIQSFSRPEPRASLTVITPAPELTNTLEAGTAPRLREKKRWWLTVSVLVVLGVAAGTYASVADRRELPSPQRSDTELDAAHRGERIGGLLTTETIPPTRDPATTLATTEHREPPVASTHLPAADRVITAKQARPSAKSPPVSARHTLAAPRSTCDPPTYLDSDGIRHFKPGCL